MAIQSFEVLVLKEGVPKPPLLVSDYLYDKRSHHIFSRTIDFGGDGVIYQTCGFLVDQSLIKTECLLGLFQKQIL